MAWPAPPAKWKVTHAHSVDVDPGNGTLLSSTTTTTTITPSDVHLETESSVRQSKPQLTQTRKPLSPADREALERAVPLALAHCGNYALSPFVPDEGSDSTSLELEWGDQKCVMDLGPSRTKKAPPRAVLDLLALIARVAKP